MDYASVLIKPLVSEKATYVKEAADQVVFFVHPEANKIQVKAAVEKAFDVKVMAVNVVRKRAGDRKRFGRKVGHESGYKKAYVTLEPGQKIEFFEGV